MTINERERLFAYSLGVILKGKPEAVKTVVEILQYLHEEGRFQIWAERVISSKYGAGHTTSTKDMAETSDMHPDPN